MSGQLPLKGLRVLDLASFIAGPAATTVMGELGFGAAEIAALRDAGALG
ncbi:MAG: CoA transferase [Reyranella sp.]|nr:CoA transferase [Reyranella sp.]MDP1962101.1 CoA transferase [Reyranella sp.]MDP2378809.1 CoA transferase [Reyranella sp.]